MSTIKEEIYQQEISNKTDRESIKAFFDYFKRIDNLSEFIAEDYFEKTKKLMQNKLGFNTKLFDEISAGIKNMLHVLFNSSNRAVSDLGVELLYLYYKEYERQGLQIKDGFESSVLYDTVRDISTAFEHISYDNIEVLYKLIPLWVLRTQIQDDDRGKDVATAIRLPKFLLSDIGNNKKYLKLLAKTATPYCWDNSFLINEKEDKELEVNQKKNALLDYYLSFAGAILYLGEASILGSFFLESISEYLEEDIVKKKYVFGVVVLCLYYAFFEREVKIEDRTKEECFNMLRTNWEKLSDCFSDWSFTYEDIKEVSSILHDSEIFSESKAKFIIMDSVVKEVFVLLSAICKTYDFSSECAQILVNNEGASFGVIMIERKQRMMELLSTFLEKVDKSFNGFEQNQREQIINNYWDTIEKAFSGLAIQAKITEGDKILEGIGDMDKWAKDMSNKMKDYVNGFTRIFTSDINNPTNYSSKKITILTVKTDVYAFKTTSFLSHFLEHIRTVICINILHALRPYLELERFPESLSEKWFEGFKRKSEQYDSVMGYELKAKDYYLQNTIDNFFDTKKPLLVHPSDDRKLAVFDSSKLSVAFDGFVVETTECDIEEEKKALNKTEDGRYEVKIVNNTVLPFTEEELCEYIKKNKRKVSFSCQMYVLIGDDKVGFMIEDIDKAAE